MPRCWPSVRAEVDRLVAADDALLGRFAAAIDSFPEESGGWWNRLLLGGEQDKPALDLKKSGIFPIVHGVRSLALSEHVQATGTQARIDALVAAGRLSSELRHRSGRQPPLPDGAEAEGRPGRARRRPARSAAACAATA